MCGFSDTRIKGFYISTCVSGMHVKMVVALAFPQQQTLDSCLQSSKKFFGRTTQAMASQQSEPKSIHRNRTPYKCSRLSCLPAGNWEFLLSSDLISNNGRQPYRESAQVHLKPAVDSKLFWQPLICKLPIVLCSVIKVAQKPTG